MSGKIWKLGGGPGGIRTLGPSVKSRLLYLAELRAPCVRREIWSLYISLSEGGGIHSPAVASLAIFNSGRGESLEVSP